MRRITRLKEGIKTAQRRMFNHIITDSDTFLDLPATAQALYFHLNMHADDDGFVSNAKAIMRMIGSHDDDLKVLLAKQFLILFDDSMIVIKHWRLHNAIRKDRYQRTNFQDDFKRLMLAGDGSYKLTNQATVGVDGLGNQMATKRQPNGNQTATQVRLGKVRLDNNTIISDGGVSNEKPASKEHSEDGDKSKLEDDFDKLWKLYPRKVGKKPAFASYKRAVTRKKYPATNKQIQDGIIAYTQQIAQDRTDARYIKQGSTFFSQESWNDYAAIKASAKPVRKSFDAKETVIGIFTGSGSLNATLSTITDEGIPVSLTDAQAIIEDYWTHTLGRSDTSSIPN